MTNKLSRDAPAEAYIESSQLARLLLDSTGEAIYALDMLGNCTFCNTACLRLLGYKEPVEIIGKNMHSTMHHSHADGTPYPSDECRIYAAFRRGHSDLQRAGIAVQTELADNLPAVVGDRVQLQQVVLNLAMSGIDALVSIANRPRKLLIKSVIDSEGALVMVQDNGIGLDPRLMEHIFQPFFTQTRPILQKNRSPLDIPAPETVGR